MKFITYKLDFTTWTVWTSGLLVKDALTLKFENSKTGEVFTVNAVINYSARSYGRMTRLLNPQPYLDNRILDKHYKYMYRAINFSVKIVSPILDALKGKEFKSVNHFIREYNKRVWVYG